MSLNAHLLKANAELTPLRAALVISLILHAIGVVWTLNKPSSSPSVYKQYAALSATADVQVALQPSKTVTPTTTPPDPTTVPPDPTTIPSEPIVAESVVKEVVKKQADPAAVIQPSRSIKTDMPTKTKPPSIKVSQAVSTQRTESDKLATPDQSAQQVGTSDADIKDDYRAQIRAVLAQHQQYPRIARIRDQQGQTLIRFSIGPKGDVIDKTLLKSSGHDILDRSALASIDQASPFPVFPLTYTDDKLTLTIPFSFYLK